MAGSLGGDLLIFRSKLAADIPAHEQVREAVGEQTPLT